MSVSSVRNEIKKAMVLDSCSGPHVSTAEMRGIVKKAEADGVVSPGEAALIADVLEHGKPKKAPSGGFMTMACPESGSNSFTIDKGAVSSANAMFARNALPYGSNEAKMRDKLEARIDAAELGPEIKKPSLRGLHPITIRDQRPVDGNMVEAYVDPKKDRMFVKITGAGMGGPGTVGPYWYGPLAAGLKEKEVSTATTKKLLKAAQEAIGEGVEFSASSPPLGVRMVRVPLFAEKHPDGFSYAALIPVGALSPTAPKADPNKASSFWLERSGGFAGLTQVAGPVEI